MTVFSEKRGSALMQVLVLGGVMASIVILLLRFAVGRTVNVVKTTRTISAKAYAESCMAEFTALAALRELHGLPPPLTAAPYDAYTTDAAAVWPSYNNNKEYFCEIVLSDSPLLSKNATMVFTPVFASRYLDADAAQYISIPNTIMKVAVDVTNTDEL
ncbi:MAG: hypothetical protein LBG46_03260 [Elusimicrobiota bacterium]|jgi:hypothetical protein|nr:hypothetical protein [Elusimicrobiota bacterium]